MLTSEFGEEGGDSPLSLNLQLRGLTRLPHDVLCLRNIRQLDASRNAFESLEDFALLPQLQELSLYFNKVSSLSAVVALATLPRLISLDLRMNPVCRLSGYRRCGRAIR